MFQARRFYEDYGIDYSDGTISHKHTRRGWINRPCPFCTGNPGLHLGYNESNGYYVCYRCGGHSAAKVVRALRGSSWTEAKRLVSAYGGEEAYKTKRAREAKEKEIEVVLPKGSGPLIEQHRVYLVARYFDPEALEDIWGLLGTNHLGPYKWRIIAPILFGGKLVSYQGRDITGRSDKKYKACARDSEQIHHKQVLYGYDLADRDVLVVEGVTDVWRMGPGSVATFGIKYTPAQVKLLSQFRRVFVWFDEEDPEAEEKNLQLASELTALGVDSEVIRAGIEGDPGDLNQKDADYVMRELLIRR